MNPFTSAAILGFFGYHHVNKKARHVIFDEFTPSGGGFFIVRHIGGVLCEGFIKKERADVRRTSALGECARVARDKR